MSPTADQVLRRCFRSGTARSIHLPEGGVIVQGSHLKAGVTFIPSTQFDVIVDIETASGDTVHLAMCPVAPSGPDLMSFIKPQEKRRPLKLHSLLDYAGVLVPVLDPLGCPTHKGAKELGDLIPSVKKGRTVYTAPYVINQPFLVWIERHGPRPLFIAHFTQEHFRK